MIKNFFKTKNCQIFMQLISNYIYFIYFIKKSLFFLIFKGGGISPWLRLAILLIKYDLN
jgi:hypothetical protein